MVSVAAAEAPMIRAAVADAKRTAFMVRRTENEGNVDVGSVGNNFSRVG